MSLAKSSLEPSVFTRFGERGVSFLRKQPLPRAAYHCARQIVSILRGIFKQDEFGLSWREAKRLQYSPRLLHTQAPLLGKQIALTDPYWYLFCYDEIFKGEMYKFKAETETPFIIDCGANIGLSVIYFKYLYPRSKIVAFEPDAEIFQVLEQNVKTFQLDDVTLHQNALWTSETELKFQGDGSVGGRLWDNGGDGGTIVKTARLQDFLHQKVDFLKIDIEGAEYEVLKDCKDLLVNVDYLFVEHHGLEDGHKTFDEITQIIRNAGFQYHLKEAWPIRHPFMRDERGGYSLQLNIFAYRNSN